MKNITFPRLRLPVVVLLFCLLSSDRGQTNPVSDEIMTAGPAPAGRPTDPAWGFWPKFPKDWQVTHWNFVEQARKGGVDVLFMGDSITKNWKVAGKELWDANYKPLRSLNIGIGGDTTRQTLWRIQNDALDGVNPKVIVIMIGVNNIFTGTGTDDEIVQGIEKILTQTLAQCPEAKVLLLGILPLGNRGQSDRAGKINAQLAALAVDRVKFLNISPAFVDPTGKVIADSYFPDQIHLSASGYQVFDKELRPVLMEMLR